MSDFRKFFNVDQRQSDNTSQKYYNGSWSWAGIVKAVVSNSYKAIACYAYLLKAVRSWVFFLLKKCMRDWIITLILYLDVCLFSLTEGQWQEIKKKVKCPNFVNFLTYSIVRMCWCFSPFTPYCPSCMTRKARDTQSSVRQSSKMGCSSGLQLVSYQPPFAAAFNNYSDKKMKLLITGF